LRSYSSSTFDFFLQQKQYKSVTMTTKARIELMTMSQTIAGLFPMLEFTGST